MCGIAGIVDLKAARDIDRDALQRMADALKHRGPDGEGFFVAPGIGLAHRRLAIIDREGGAQPMKTAAGAGVIVHNGEIYNYAELAAGLRAQGVGLRTRSDTEVVAEGLASQGAAFVGRLRGMFAFAFWDGAARTLTLCRDRLGEKPVYYATTPDGLLIFASEVGALAASGLLALELDPQAVADYLLYGFIPDPKSVYRAVRKLPPATILTAARGGAPRLARYWRAEFSPAPRQDYDAAKDELLSRLDQAVELQMISDVPLGAFLSGGVDSSAIVSAMAGLSRNVKTCSIGFGESSHDERAFARLVAQRYRTEHFEEVARVDAQSLIDDVARRFGEPFADTSALPFYTLAKLARRHVTVALSGDGADEIFAGYRRYPFFVNEERVRAALPLGFRRATFGAAGARYPKLDFAPRPLRLKTTLQSLGGAGADAYAHALAANLPDRVARLMGRDFRAALGPYRPESVVAAALPGDAARPLLAAQAADLETWLPGRMLVKVDRMSMAHGLEVRAPFLDHVLVEWAGAIDPSFKLRGGVGKRILKSALERRLPTEILNRKKQGFGIPAAAWLRAADGPITRLSDSNAWRNSGYFDARAVEGMAAAHRRGGADCSQELWTVIMFDAFMRTCGAQAPNRVRPATSHRVAEIAP